MHRLPLPVFIMLLVFLAPLLACDAQGTPQATLSPEQVQDLATIAAQAGVEVPAPTAATGETSEPALDAQDPSCTHARYRAWRPPIRKLRPRPHRKQLRLRSNQMCSPRPAFRPPSQPLPPDSASTAASGPTALCIAGGTIGVWLRARRAIETCSTRLLPAPSYPWPSPA